MRTARSTGKWGYKYDLATKARATLGVYLRRGKVAKTPCPICGDSQVKAFYLDYAKPLQVIWLCAEHHSKLNRMTIGSIADITGDSAAHPISTTKQPARFLILTSSGGDSRFGDANVSAARGAKLVQDIPVYISLASQADATDKADLSQAHAYVPSGATLTIAYGV